MSADCPTCDGTGNFYRHDEDGDFLDCDDCHGTGKLRGLPTDCEGSEYRAFCDHCTTMHPQPFSNPVQAVAELRSLGWKITETLTQSPNRVEVSYHCVCPACRSIGE